MIYEPGLHKNLNTFKYDTVEKKCFFLAFFFFFLIMFCQVFCRTVQLPASEKNPYLFFISSNWLLSTDLSSSS